MDIQQLAKLAAGRCWAGYEPVPGKAPYSNDSCRPVGSKKKKKAEKKAFNHHGVKDESGVALQKTAPVKKAPYGSANFKADAIKMMERVRKSRAKQASAVQILAAMASNLSVQEKQAMITPLLFASINSLLQKKGDRGEGLTRGLAIGFGSQLGAGAGGISSRFVSKDPRSVLLGLLGGGLLGAIGTQKLIGPASYAKNNAPTGKVKSSAADPPCSCNCGDIVSTCKCGPDCTCRKPGGSCYKGEKEASLMPLALAAGAVGSYPYARGAVSAMQGPKGYGVQEGVHGYLRGIGELGGGVAGAGLGGALGPVLAKKLGGGGKSQAAAALLGALSGAGVGGYGGNRLIRKLTGKSPSEKEKENKSEKAANVLEALAGGLSSGVSALTDIQRKQAEEKEKLERAVARYTRERLARRIAADKIASEKQAGKRGLWDNIHAKRKRGEKPAKPGEKDYPDSKSWSKTVKAGSAIQVLAKLAASAAWQRSEGKNPEGGLNAKGRASYNASTGGNLKAPVTSKNPKGESAKRKSSFCARMGGMKSKLTGEKAKNDPDSRINKALRKWNC